MNDPVLYFIIYPNGDESKITVIDLAQSVSYQRSEWTSVNDENFHDRDEAIETAKALAVKYSLTYLPFESRYNSNLSEPKHKQLSLDD
ncbi:hypothetical protein HUO09_17660 [Vibrio sp. Y2-5]|uniref:hypothetical protein n=1 Tax=Vibrio sp. Y2-5 TaxID=2743977 RepID=UPI0016617146|nr:hypothetical protein [Vibrio sp. Y2-5]MBD0788185.1 hypothetical protein [Vibrio sp. Y2-5]